MLRPFECKPRGLEIHGLWLLGWKGALLLLRKGLCAFYAGDLCVCVCLELRCSPMQQIVLYEGRRTNTFGIA